MSEVDEIIKAYWKKLSKKSKRICAICEESLKGVSWVEHEHPKISGFVRICCGCAREASAIEVKK